MTRPTFFRSRPSFPSAALIALAASAAGMSWLGSRPVAQVQVAQVVTSVAGGGGAGIAGGAPPVAMGPIQQNGTGLIVGQVVDADSGRPISGAIVAIGGAGSGPQPIQGRVANINGTPIQLGPTPAQTPRVLTDGDGRFAFRNLPKGSYNFTAQKPGYVDGAYGRLRPNGSSQSFDLGDGERRGDVRVRLFKFAAITGTVVDEAGEPAVGVQIRAFRWNLMGGHRVLSPVNASATSDDRGMYRLGGLTPGEYVVGAPTVQASVPADFRLQGPLPPDLLSTLIGSGGAFSISSGGTPVTPDGKFLLQNSSRTVLPTVEGERRMVYATQYYPNASTIQQAQAIAVKSGEERGGVDMQLRLVPALNIAGRLMQPDGPAVNWGVHLVPSDTSDLSNDPDVATSITDADGNFMFLAVPAGAYVIETVRVPRQLPAPGNFTVLQTGSGTVAFSSSVSTVGPGGAPPPPPPSDPTLWAATPVVLDRDDITDLTVQLHTGYRVSGRVDFQGSAERPTPDRLAQIPVILEPADAKQKTQTIIGRVDTTGSFTTTGLLPGKYLVRVGGAPRSWIYKSALLGGLDVSETPIDIQDRDVTGVVITFTDTPTELRGIVKGPEGVADDSSAVIVFPADTRTWIDYGINPRRMRVARAGKTGNYQFNALPAGDYYVVAINEEYAGEWQDTRFLDQLSRVASRVTLNDAEKRSMDLTRVATRPGQMPRPVPELEQERRFDQLPQIASVSGPYVPDDVDQVPPPAQQQNPPRDPKQPPPPPSPAPQAGPARDAVLPTTGTASISGVVLLDDGSQQPVRRARVTLHNVDARGERTVTTDETGRFSFPGVPTGTYNLAVAKPAYVSAFYGSKLAGRGPGTPLSVAGGQTIADVKLMLPRGGVITGRAFDDFASPVPNASVRLLQYRTVNGERTLAPAGPIVQTDDRGVYRAYGLTPGAYVVSIAPPNSGGFGSDLRQLSQDDMQAALSAVQAAAHMGSPTPGMVGATTRPAPADPTAANVGAGAGRAVGYATIYYPGTWSADDAQVVNVAAGQEMSGVDLPIHLVPTARLEGVVLGSDGQPAGGVQLTLISTSNTTLAPTFSTLRTSPEGKFSTQNIVPGHYQLTARGGGATGPARGGGAGPGLVTFGPGGPPPPPPPPPPSGSLGGGPIFVSAALNSRQYAQQELDFSGEDVTGVTLTLQDGMTVSGRIAFDARAMTPPDDLSRINLTLAPIARGIVVGVPTAEIDKSGDFTITGVMPGRYRLIANVPGASGSSGWQLKSSMVDGHDTLDDALEVRAGQNISGAVVTFTDQMAELSGRLVDATGQPAPGYTILLFSTDRSQWTTSSRRAPAPTRPASDGKYRISGLPAGEYYLAAVTDIDPQQDWGDPAYMEQIAAAALKVTLRDGEKKTQDLKIAKQ